MTETGLNKGSRKTTMRTMWRRANAVAMTAGMMVTIGGCVNVSAPDKPIVINLNINITQEVVYRLDGEAKTLIESKPGIF